MTIKLTPNSITGVPDPSGWALISDFTPASPETANLKGRIFALISVTPQNGNAFQGNESVIIGKEILRRLHEEYYAKSGDNFSLFQEAVKNVFNTFNSPNELFSIVCLVQTGDKVMISTLGGSECWIKREGLLAKLDNSTGLIKDNDEFFLGTPGFFSKITPESLKAENPLQIITNPDSSLAVMSIKVVIELPPQVPVVPQVTNLPSKQDLLPTSISRPKTISPIRLALASLIDKILLILPYQNKKGFVKEDLVSPNFNKKRKIALSAGIILFILLLVTILFGAKKKSLTDSKSRYQNVLVDARHNLDEAKTLSSVDQSKATELILSAKKEIDNLKSQNIKDPDIDNLASEINTNLGTIGGIYLETPSLYLDLGLISSGFVGDDIAVSDGRMVVLNRKAKSLQSIDIASGRRDPVAGPDVMPDSNLVAAYSDRNFVSASDGIWDIGDKATKVISKDSDIGSNILISAYAGNFYLLDKDHSKLWRYAGDGGQFGPKSNWLGTGVTPDLSSVISWTIDGNMWMLTGDNTILRFSGGSPVDFNPQNIDNFQAIDITTTQDSKYLYLLDHVNSRVIVIDKDGNLKAQYLSDNIKNATKVVVSEADNKIILLEGGSLYSLDLKNL